MKLRTALEVLTNEDPRYKKKIDEAVKTLQQALMQHKKEWVGLTDEEIAEGQASSWVDKQAFESAVWWAEKKLKEKNV